MTGLSLYYDFKNSGVESLVGYINQESVKDLVSSELRSTVVETFRDVENAIFSTLDKLCTMDLSAVSNKEIMLECFVFMENSEMILMPEYPHSKFVYTVNDKYKDLYNIAKLYTDDLRLTYDRMDANLKYLTKGYFVKKVMLTRDIINKVETLCHM